MRIKRRRKEKVKRNCLISLVIVLFALVIMFGLKTFKVQEEDNVLNTSNKVEEVDSETLINSILAYDDIDSDVTSEFLNWFCESFETSVLENIFNSLLDSSYNSRVWYEESGYSLMSLLALYNQSLEESNATNITVISGSTDKESTLSFVGDVSLADNWYIMPMYDERNKGIYGILSEEVVSYMTSSDVMVANNEFTVSERGTALAGKLYTFRGSPTRLPIYNEMGVDLVTLANNHVYDYGEDAFLDLLSALKSYNIPYIGAGENISKAKEAYYFIVNGYLISFVNATRAEKNIMTPEATESSGGVFRCYDETAFSEVIKEEKKTSDYVIALVHWGAEDSTVLETVQQETGKIYIDSGADVVVGTHAHVLQGMEFYHDGLIVYNLGDFIFNNETKDTGIFTITIDKSGNLTYSFVPCLEEDEYTSMLSGTEKRGVLDKLEALSINASFADDGTITKEE